MNKYEDQLMKKLEILKRNKDFYDINFCQMLLYIVYQNMASLGNNYESINQQILEMLENIDTVINNRPSDYFSEQFTKFLNLNRK